MKTIKNIFGFNLSLVLIVSLITYPILAQSQQPRTRGVEVEGGTDTLNVQIFQAVKNNGQIVKLEPAINPADPTLTFKSGQLVSVAYSISFDGYIYFINVGPEGTRVIYPTNTANIAPVPANLRREATLRLNNNVGREELILIVARERIAKLEEAINRPDKMLDAQTTALPNNAAEMNSPNVVAAIYRPNTMPVTMPQQGFTQPSAPSPTQPYAAPQTQPNQFTQTAPLDASATAKKTNKWKTVGIVAGGIGLSILGGWLGSRFAAPGIGGLVNQAGAQMGMPAAAPTASGQFDPNAMPVTPTMSQPDAMGTAVNMAPVPLSRGFEIETDGNNQIHAYPAIAENGNLRLNAGQVATFRISFDHQ